MGDQFRAQRGKGTQVGLVCSASDASPPSRSELSLGDVAEGVEDVAVVRCPAATGVIGNAQTSDDLAAHHDRGPRPRICTKRRHRLLLRGLDRVRHQDIGAVTNDLERVQLGHLIDVMAGPAGSPHVRSVVTDDGHEGIRDADELSDGTGKPVENQIRRDAGRGAAGDHGTRSPIRHFVRGHGQQ